MNVKKMVVILAVLSVLAAPVIISALDEVKKADWPAFRGHNAIGVADGFPTATTWNVEDNTNILWKADIPGLGHSSPIIWGNRVYVTTAVSGLEDPELKVGLYGSIKPVEDET